jgi:CBS domain-containing protein
MTGDSGPEHDASENTDVGDASHTAGMPRASAITIGRLRSANRPPVSVKPQQKLSEAVTIMLANDFSQLPVMGTEFKLMACR